jgi:hypothetical protein
MALRKRKVSALVNFTSLPNENKTQFHIVRWLAGRIAGAGAGPARWLAGRVAVAGARLFAVQDRIAMQHGWVITKRRGGLGRSYRDPRFDWLRSCSLCEGRGVVEDQPCEPCGATGRVSLAPYLEGQSP